MFLNNLCIVFALFFDVNRIENGFWVGKSSIRNWHNLAQKNLDNLILDEHCLKLLNDVNTEIQLDAEMDTKENDTKSSSREEESAIHHNGIDSVSSSSHSDSDNCSKNAGEFPFVLFFKNLISIYNLLAIFFRLY